jgi:hypothetical protein
MALNKKIAYLFTGKIAAEQILLEAGRGSLRAGL